MKSDHERFFDAVTDDVIDDLLKHGKLDPVMFFLKDDNITFLDCSVYNNEDEKDLFLKYLKKYFLPEIDGLRGAVFAFEGYANVDPESCDGTVDGLVFSYYTRGDTTRVKVYQIDRDENDRPIDVKLVCITNSMEGDILSDYFNPKTIH